MITIQKILDVDYGQELKFTLGENSAIFGSKLEVQLPVSASKWLCNEFLRRGLKFYFNESLNLFISLSIAILNLEFQEEWDHEKCFISLCILSCQSNSFSLYV